MAKLNITFAPVTEQNGLPAAAAIGTMNIFTNFAELTYEVSDMSINEIWSEFKDPCIDTERYSLQRNGFYG